MADPRALLDAYAEQIVDVESEWGVFEPIKRADAAEAMLAALRAVLDRHKPQAELVWPGPGEAEMKERHVCIECSGWGPYVAWPCPTVQAVTAALTCDDTA